MRKSFDCGRTCAKWEACRFMPMLRAIGPTVVYSHTASVSVEFRDPKALEAAVVKLGGKWLGQGTYWAGINNATGFGFELSGFYGTLVLSGDKLFYDSDNALTKIDTLKDAYAIEVVSAEAARLGWYCEPQVDGGLLVYHPSGGTLSVSPNGTIDANGFTGTTCAEASAHFEAALGRTTGSTRKESYGAVKAIQPQS